MSLHILSFSIWLQRMNARLNHQADTYVRKVIEDSGIVASATMGEQTGTSDWIFTLIVFFKFAYLYVRSTCVWCLRVFWLSIFVQAIVNCPTNSRQEWISNFIGWHGPGATRCIMVPNFVKIRQSVVGLSWFFDFSIWWLPPSWISEILKFY